MLDEAAGVAGACLARRDVEDGGLGVGALNRDAIECCCENATDPIGGRIDVVPMRREYVVLTIISGEYVHPVLPEYRKHRVWANDAIEKTKHDEEEG